MREYLHYHNFSPYLCAFVLTNACLHSYIDLRCYKHMERGLQVESSKNNNKRRSRKKKGKERVQVWLFVDVFFQNNGCSKLFSRSSTYWLLFFYATIYYCECCDTHPKYPSYVWLVSISRQCMWHTSNPTRRVPSSSPYNWRRRRKDMLSVIKIDEMIRNRY